MVEGKNVLRSRTFLKKVNLNNALQHFITKTI